jgi:phage gp36-like protein
MTQYATLKDLIYRADGDEVVQRGLSSLRATYRHEVPSAASLDAAVSDPRVDDVAMATDDGLLYLYNGTTWSAIETPKVDQALLDASAVADDYLRGRYTLPLAGLPRTLVLMVCDIARYFLYDDAVIDIVEKRYRDAVSWLIKIAAGTVTLDSVEAEPPATSTGSANISGPGRVFSRDSMRDL